MPAAVPGELDEVEAALVGEDEPASLSKSEDPVAVPAETALLPLLVSPEPWAELGAVVATGLLAQYPDSITVGAGSNATLPKSVAQQPRNDFPSFAPAVETITPVLQYPESQKTDVEPAMTLPAEHEVGD
ncbi:hypothetical protein SLS60_004776 [Paraconiothyrium brasiliense]|uniref:Uncharacterized protein n=1 Tax=Paraconiothyrium brasiliense TaxID=300254 RepID=A0ABR3RMT9_9PLEO